MSMSSELNEYILVVYIFEKQLSLFLFFLVSFCAHFIMRKIFYILATSSALEHQYCLSTNMNRKYHHYDLQSVQGCSVTHGWSQLPNQAPGA